jgi:hypothetical protein
MSEKRCLDCWHAEVDPEDTPCRSCFAREKFEPRNTAGDSINHPTHEDKPNGPYHHLHRILGAAGIQASDGKGKERHAFSGEKFEEQKIVIINRWVAGSPAAGNLYQVIKKAAEAAHMEPDRAIHELYGAIVYAAAGIYALEQEKEAQDA